MHQFVDMATLSAPSFFYFAAKSTIDGVMQIKLSFATHTQYKGGGGGGI